MNRLHKALNLVLILVLSFSFGAGLPAAAQPALYTYAGGLQLTAATLLPVFRVISPDVTVQTALGLGGAFSEIGNVFDPVPTDKYLGFTRFTLLNDKNNTVLEQFGATGGFYAYSPSRAFGSDALPNAVFNPANAQRLACLYLSNHPQFIPAAGADLEIQVPSKCDHDFAKVPLYRVSTETLTSQNVTPGAAPAAAFDTPLRMLVTMPIVLHVELYNKELQAPLPLGGAGGHLSFIFNDTTLNPTTPGPALDSIAYGLQAVAMPTFGRSFTHIRNVPAVDPALAQSRVLEQVKAAYPDASAINVPLPTLQYDISDAASPQTALEPVLDFAGVTVELPGAETLFLRNITLPATDAGPGGLGPTVVIHSPVSGFHAFPSTAVVFKGSISDGVAPYTFEWQLGDGSPLSGGGGTLDVPGDLPVFSTLLPAPDAKGPDTAQIVRLVVTDSEGFTRQAEVSLDAPLPTFIPMLMKPGSLLNAIQPAQRPAAVLAPSATNYRFGVEYGSDYPPYGPGGSDLGGVPPDANGLSAGLLGLGWPRVFNWYNASAWERDWRDCALGGSDCTYGVDRADYVYYAGHGSNGGIAMPSNTHDSSWFDGSNARFQVARWVGFASCLTLRVQGFPAGSEPIRRWFNAFQGAHLIMGFNSLMADVAFGPRLVDNMRMPSFLGIIDFPWAQRTIAEAWVQTAFQLNAGRPAYIYATSAGVNPIGNKLPKPGDALMPRPTPVNWFYWVWWNE